MWVFEKKVLDSVRGASQTKEWVMEQLKKEVSRGFLYVAYVFSQLLPSVSLVALSLCFSPLGNADSVLVMRSSPLTAELTC